MKGFNELLAFKEADLFCFGFIFRKTIMAKLSIFLLYVI